MSKLVVLLGPMLLLSCLPAAADECDSSKSDCSADPQTLLQTKAMLDDEHTAETGSQCRKWCAQKVAKGKTCSGELCTWDLLCGWTDCLACEECSAAATTAAATTAAATTAAATTTTAVITTTSTTTTTTTTTMTTTTTITTTTSTTTATTVTEWQSPYFMMSCPGGEQAITTASMTFDEYDAAIASVQALYDSLDSTCNATYCPQADFAGCVLRIAGHDFMDYMDGTGGADGCLDLHDADNAGLAECIYAGEHGKSIADAYEGFCTTISLADFFVISAEAVMQSSRQHVLDDDSTRSAIDFRSRFKYGRTTATNCAFAEGRLPNPENSCSAVETTFVERMGLDWSKAAALMGVHSLGRAQISNSGYNGWWSDFENSRRFNNDYYVSILLKGWAPETSVGGNAGKNQWRRVDIGADEATLGKEMMLNTDMCLFFTMDDEGTVELDAATALENECNCTWPSYTQVEDSANTYNNGKFCGSDDAEVLASFQNQRAICCGLTEWNADPRSTDDEWMDCGLPKQPAGPAASNVRSFANDEDKWIAQFERAWSDATTNGFDSLKKLRD